MLSIDFKKAENYDSRRKCVLICIQFYHTYLVPYNSIIHILHFKTKLKDFSIVTSLMSDEEVDPFEYWNQAKKRFPCLSQIVPGLLVVPASTGDV